MYHFQFQPARNHFWKNPLIEKELDKFFANTEEELHAPSYEIRDEENHFAVSVDIPGIKKEDISIEVKDNQLYVTGERKNETKSEKNNVLRSEKRYGKFSRVFTLPPNVNTEAIGATFENGVLEIALPKDEKATSRKIAISN